MASIVVASCCFAKPALLAEIDISKHCFIQFTAGKSNPPAGWQVCEIPIIITICDFPFFLLQRILDLTFGLSSDNDIQPVVIGFLFGGGNDLHLVATAQLVAEGY